MKELNEEQVKLILDSLPLFKDATEECIKDYGDLVGHSSEVVEMKRQLVVIEEIQQLLA